MLWVPNLSASVNNEMMMGEVEHIVSGNLARVQERIERAASQAQRAVNEVQLVAVAKYVDAQTTKSLLDAGCTLLGESRPQQLWQKADEPSLAAAKWHMIGHLQRNKVARTVPLVDLIHSVDSHRLLKAIDDTSRTLGKRTRVLLEVNTSGDEEKHGISADGLKALLPQLADCQHAQVCGLMTMAAREGGTAVASQNFADLRRLRDEVANEIPPQHTLDELSMGMSHDFEEAIREGATLVRIGSLLFDGIR